MKDTEPKCPFDKMSKFPVRLGNGDTGTRYHGLLPEISKILNNDALDCADRASQILVKTAELSRINENDYICSNWEYLVGSEIRKKQFDSGINYQDIAKIRGLYFAKDNEKGSLEELERITETMDPGWISILIEQGILNTLGSAIEDIFRRIQLSDLEGREDISKVLNEEINKIAFVKSHHSMIVVCKGQELAKTVIATIVLNLCLKQDESKTFIKMRDKNGKRKGYKKIIEEFLTI